MKFVKHLQSNRGSISVYLCIIMASVILLCGVLADFTRIRSADVVAEDVTISVSRSLMSLYHRDLEKFYGIMGVQIRPEVKTAVNQLILKNIATEDGADLFRLKLDGFQIQQKESLGNSQYLKKAITSHCVDDLAKEWITDKIEGFQILGELYKNRGLIGDLLPDPAEEAKEDFAKINESLKESGDLGKAISGIAEQLLLNEYILNHFSCYTGSTNQAATTEDEAEYILTGFDTPGARKAAVIALLTGTRFALNIGYFVTSPVMMQKALVYATTVAGWSGIGIPIAQAAIIVTWSLAESVIDVEQLLSGKAVPLVKSPTTWVLSETGLIDAAKNIIVDRTLEAANSVVDDSFDKIEDVVVKAISDIEGKIKGELNLFVDKISEPLENQIKGLATVTLKEAEKAIDACFSELENTIMDFQGDGIIFDTLKAYAQDWLEDIKEQIKSEIQEMISKPEEMIKKYKRKLVDKLTEPMEKVKEKLISEIKEASKKGRDALKDKLSSLLSSGKNKTSNSLTASTFKSGFITMRYKDYLRLYLLVVPENQKFGRVRDLIEANIRKKTNDSSFSLDEMACGVNLKLNLSIGYFLTPSKMIPSGYKTPDGSRHLLQKDYSTYYLTGGAVS